MADAVLWMLAASCPRSALPITVSGWAVGTSKSTVTNDPKVTFGRYCSTQSSTHGFAMGRFATRVGRCDVKSGERSPSPDPRHAPAARGCAPAARGVVPRDNRRQILRGASVSRINCAAVRHSFHQSATLTRGRLDRSCGREVIRPLGFLSSGSPRDLRQQGAHRRRPRRRRARRACRRST